MAVYMKTFIAFTFALAAVTTLAATADLFSSFFLDVIILGRKLKFRKE